MIKTRILAVDPGDKRIGLAVSDPEGVIANPIAVIRHQNRKMDSLEIIKFANEQGAGLIVVGFATDSEGNTSPQGRKAERLVDEIRQNTEIPVKLWDESFTTQIARAARIQMGGSRKKRAGHVDELAATVLLQDYLDSKEAS